MKCYSYGISKRVSLLSVQIAKVNVLQPQSSFPVHLQTLEVKAPANDETLLRKHCCFSKCFPVCAARKQCFRNSVSAAMFPRLRGPLVSSVYADCFCSNVGKTKNSQSLGDEESVRGQARSKRAKVRELNFLYHQERLANWLSFQQTSPCTQSGFHLRVVKPKPN